MLKGFSHSLKAIANEAIATANELREAHNPENWQQTEHNRGDANEYSSQPAPPMVAQPTTISPRRQPPASVAPPPSLTTTTTPAPVQPADDVSARLQALKAKLAKTNSGISRTATLSSQPTPPPSLQPPPPPPPVVAPPPPQQQQQHQQQQKDDAIIALEKQLEQERLTFSEQIEQMRRDAKNELTTARTENVSLRDEIEQLRADVAAATLAQQQQQQTALESTQNNNNDNNNNTSNDDKDDDLRAEVASLQDALMKTEAECAVVKQQLSRLKGQMLTEQEDEEDKVRWRVEAEVKLELEKRGVAANGATAATATSSIENDDTAAMAEMAAAWQQQLEASEQRGTRAEQEVVRWERMSAAKDVELSNLQRALGEMSYESDAAERLRTEVRALQAETHSLRNELDVARVALLGAEKSVQQAEAATAAAQNDAVVARNAEAEVQRQLLTAKHAARELHELRKDGAMVNRKAVIQTLIGILRLKRPRDALDLAATTLGLTADEIESIKGAAAASAALRQGGSGGGGNQSLASSWVDFLQSAVQEGEGSAGSAGVGVVMTPNPVI